MLVSSQQVAIMVPIHESRFVAVLQLLRIRCCDPLASELSFDSVNFVLLDFCFESRAVSIGCRDVSVFWSWRAPCYYI